MNKVLRDFAQRRRVGHQPADDQPDGEQTPASIDAGAHGALPSSPPSMNDWLREAHANRRGHNP